VGDLEADGLEVADRTVELPPLLGVRSSILQRTAGQADRPAPARR
jgi:hypothetical protein